MEVTMTDLTSLKDKFVAIYRENITRPGADRLLEYLLSDSSDFFTAPASTRYHGAYEGGLCEHSINVYECLKNYLERERVKDIYGLDYSDETIALVALLHDLCKVNLYRISYRNAKNEMGVWEKVPYFEFHDTLPYSHGEKSVYLCMRHIQLTPEEALAIRWHMGGYDDAAKSFIGGRTQSNAYEKVPLCAALNLADTYAAHFRA